MKKLLFALLFMSTASLALAQDSTSADAKKWEFQVEGGLSLPISKNFSDGSPGYSDGGFKTGYNYGGAVGYKITPQLSILADLEWHEFDAKDDTSASGYVYYWNTTEIALLMKYRIFKGGFSPYVFFGPGAAVDVAGYKYTTYYTPPYHNYAEQSMTTDFLLQAGIGLEYAMTDDFSVFAQAKESFVFSGAALADWTVGYSVDMPTRYVPVQAGLILNL